MSAFVCILELLISFSLFITTVQCGCTHHPCHSLIIIIARKCYFIIFEIRTPYPPFIVEVAPKTNDTLPGEDAKDFALVRCELCVGEKLKGGNSIEDIRNSYLMEHLCRTSPDHDARMLELQSNSNGLILGNYSTKL
jgi:hypothetical protein